MLLIYAKKKKIGVSFIFAGDNVRQNVKLVCVLCVNYINILFAHQSVCSVCKSQNAWSSTWVLVWMDSGTGWRCVLLSLLSYSAEKKRHIFLFLIFFLFSFIFLFRKFHCSSQWQKKQFRSKKYHLNMFRFIQITKDYFGRCNVFMPMKKRAKTKIEQQQSNK